MKKKIRRRRRKFHKFDKTSLDKSRQRRVNNNNNNNNNNTEALLCAAQEQAIRTIYVKHYIDKTSESPLCSYRLCGKKCESVQHLICGSEKLAQKEYKRRHDNVAKKVHWDFCKKNGLEHTEKWYEHVQEGVVENEEIKVLWDINVQCDNVIEARRLDIIVIDKKERKGIIIDITVPADVRVGRKKGKK